MAKLGFSENGLVSLVCGSKFKILDYNDGACKFSYNLSDIKVPQDTKKPNQESNDDNKQDVALGHGNVSAFSQSGKLFALSTLNKILVIWKTDTWEQVCIRTIEKKATKIMFTKSEDYCIVADKAGDVYKYDVYNSESKGIFLLGHISMIMDMAVTENNRYVITADRDEKIRVSRYNQPYIIESYCLGHTDFVSSIKVLSNDEFLVSGSGDGSVIFWDFKCGKTSHIERPITSENTDDNNVIMCITYCRLNNVVCVAMEKSTNLHLFHVSSEQNISTLPSLSTKLPPWDVAFDYKGLLWCLLPNFDEPVVVYRQDKNMNQYAKIETLEDLPVYNGLNEWDFLKECIGKEPKLSLLRKKTDSDNMKEYLTRKEERIQQKQAKKEELEAKEAEKKAKRLKV